MQRKGLVGSLEKFQNLTVAQCHLILKGYFEQIDQELKIQERAQKRASAKAKRHGRR